MDKFASYLRKLDITQNVTEEEVEKTEMLLHVYAPTLRSAAHRLEELGEECYEGRRQTISDFINLAIDYDRDADRKRIAERLSDMGHSMELLSILENYGKLGNNIPPILKTVLAQLQDKGGQGHE